MIRHLKVYILKIISNGQLFSNFPTIFGYRVRVPCDHSVNVEIIRLVSFYYSKRLRDSGERQPNRRKRR